MYCIIRITIRSIAFHFIPLKFNLAFRIRCYSAPNLLQYSGKQDNFKVANSAFPGPAERRRKTTEENHSEVEIFLSRPPSPASGGQHKGEEHHKVKRIGINRLINHKQISYISSIILIREFFHFEALFVIFIY
jgi:hypothetical protein